MGYIILEQKSIYFLYDFEEYILITKHLNKYRIMQSKSMKNILGVGALLLVVAFLSSCNRGGVGCPYELSAATDVIFHIMN